MRGAEITLAQLARISLVIRKAGAQLRHQRADKALQDSLTKYGLFKERSEFLFIWNPFQEDISPYHKLLFGRLTSNETQKNFRFGGTDWPGFSDPSRVSGPSLPGTRLNLSDWRNVYDWMLSQDTGDEASENASYHSSRQYDIPATVSLRYKRDIDLPHPISLTATKPEGWPVTVIRKVLTDPERLTSIQKRLVRANIKRRHRFDFARGSAKPIDSPPKQEIKIPKSPERVVEQSINAVLLPVVSVAPPPVELVKQTPSKPSIAAKSVLSATELGSQQALDFKAPTPSVVTRVSATGQKLKYPPRPKIGPDRANFECHYCHQVLPRVYGETGWRYSTSRRCSRFHYFMLVFYRENHS